ncbi:MAG TPA: class I SAM-dependent methyltransferase [Albitalea sp.]|uniref:class I SAM-dependent methyltransferase n=1 Tax=Piscinibacter sp. TaxID=1903157 RepID=UPI002ED3AF12
MDTTTVTAGGALPSFIDLRAYRQSATERQRSDDLMRLAAGGAASALDVGARDGYFSRLLAERYQHVVALDLVKPSIAHPRVSCIAGDATAMPFADAGFDLVLCAEVLEHIPPPLLARACAELARVTRTHLLVGVPFEQDTRVGRTTCGVCGQANPPWGHVNQFDETRLRSLFAGMRIEAMSFVGESRDSTNALSRVLMDLAGNPYGTYGQDEPCVFCGASIMQAPSRSLAQKALTRAAFWARGVTEVFDRPRPAWIHLLLRKEP